MACQICTDVIDAQSKQRIVTLLDAFGSKHVVQIIILTEPNPEAVIAAEMAAMNQRETDFIQKLTAMGKTAEEIDALRRNPGDCGCGGAS